MTQIRSIHARAFHWLAALSLAAYGVVGVFGNSLHGILPCSDESCGSGIATAVEGLCSCCHHDQAPTPAASGPATNGAEFRAAGHDADDCSLCTLLAKIKVGHAALDMSAAWTDDSREHVMCDELRAPADVLLAFAARGPPAC
ncbi:MAG: hypothetical protein H0T51_08655 [Pirellulales bacterium]|nr:hypothetical protein [Pirellulales bacterium]